MSTVAIQPAVADDARAPFGSRAPDASVRDIGVVRRTGVVDDPDAGSEVRPTDTGESGAARARTRAETLRSLFRAHRTLIVASLAVIVAMGGGALILAPASAEKTDDAYLGADVTTVAPRVRGFVADVMVRDNQTVHAGDPLVRIDSEEFDARVGTARAELADAEAGVASAAAALTSLDAEENLASANVRAARTAIRSANAEATRASLDAKRYDSLVETGAVSVREAETLRTRAIAAEQEAAHSAALLGVSEESQHVTSAKRAALTAALQKASATVERAHAAVDLALQDQRHTLIRAPIDGVVGNRQVQQGDFLQPGTRLLTLVPLHDLYVTANFKETQTARMHPGQHATVRVDAVPGHSFTGVVESLAPGSGSQFALLPFEPGTGNFTKIVQRVGVRIRFEPGQSALDALRPGLSVTAKVVLE
jgi:membrane fusion protein (multidrug efflux system)